MILTVTLNVALDRTVAVPNFHLGNRHRAVEARTVAGGKGVNVARALKLLGEPVIATGLAGGPTGSRIRELLAEESSSTTSSRSPQDSRTNLSIVDPTSGEQTEINERGPSVAPEDFERFIEQLLYLAQGADFCVVAGSVPPGLEPDVYAHLIGELRSLGVPTLLDTDGEPMRLGLRARPDVVAPNVLEAEEAVGHEFTDPDDLALGLGGLLEMGADEAIVTRANGCVAIIGENGAPPPLRGRDRSARADRRGRLRRRLPRRLLSARVPGRPRPRRARLRGRLRRRVDPALRRRGARPGRGRAAALEGPGARARGARRRPDRRAPDRPGFARLTAVIIAEALEIRASSRKSRTFGPSSRGLFRPRARLAWGLLSRR